MRGGCKNWSSRYPRQLIRAPRPSSLTGQSPRHEMNKSLLLSGVNDIAKLHYQDTIKQLV